MITEGNAPALRAVGPVARVRRSILPLQSSPLTDKGKVDMTVRSQSPVADSPACAEEESYKLDDWMHDFRNALGTILLGADAAKALFQRNAEISLAMGRIEDGCNRCLRLLRTMPPS